MWGKQSFLSEGWSRCFCGPHTLSITWGSLPVGQRQACNCSPLDPPSAFGTPALALLSTVRVTAAPAGHPRAPVHSYHFQHDVPRGSRSFCEFVCPCSPQFPCISPSHPPPCGPQATAAEAKSKSSVEPATSTMASQFCFSGWTPLHPITIITRRIAVKQEKNTK